MAKRSAALRSIPKVTPPKSQLETAAGASAAIEGDSIVVRNPLGDIVVVYDSLTGSATIVAPQGDLKLESPHGRVLIAAGKDLELTSGARTRLQSDLLELAVSRATLKAGFVDLAAEAIQLVSPGVTLGIGRLQLDAQRVFQRAQETYQEVQGAMETRAGRVRTLVKGATQLFSKSTSIVSEEDTFVDGRRVLLG
jgi:hypothetical protein